MTEQYGLKVWLELAVKNAKEIKANVEDQLKNIDIKGILEKSKIAGGAAKRVEGFAEAAGIGKNLTKLAATAGAILGVLYVLKKIATGMWDRMVRSSPYLQGILSVLDRAWTLVWRPFGDFLGNLLRPLAVILMRLAVKWLQFTRTPVGETTVQGMTGAGAGALAGAGIGAAIGTLGGPLGVLGGALAGAGIGAAIGTSLTLLDEAWEGAKNLAIISAAWNDELLKIFGIDMQVVREKVVSFFFVTLPKFFSETLPNWFTEQSEDLGDFASHIWDNLTDGVSNVTSKLNEFPPWLWGKITDGLNNVQNKMSGLPQWLWDEITDGLSNLKQKISGIPAWLWDKITSAFSTIGNWLNGFGSWLWDEITGAFDNIGSWLGGIGIFLYQKITTSITDAFSDFTFGWSWFWSKGSAQIGRNYVDQTGLYQLHRGEEVVTAPRAEKNGKGGNGIVLSPTFNIIGNGRMDSDINSQVRSAARMLEFEVRRRNLL